MLIFRNLEYKVSPSLLVEVGGLDQRLYNIRKTAEHLISQMCMFNEVSSASPYSFSSTTFFYYYYRGCQTMKTLISMNFLQP